MKELFFMSNPKQIVELKILGLGLIVLFGLLLMFFTDNKIVHLIIVWGIAAYAAAIVRFDLIHPYCWFSFTFALYNTAYTMLNVFGYDRSAGYSTLNSIYTVIALGIVLLIVGPVKINSYQRIRNKIRVNFTLNNIIFQIFAVMTIVFAIILLVRGYSGKSEMIQERDIFFRLGVNIIRWMMVLMVIQMVSYQCSDIKKNSKYILVTLISALLMGLFTGERDIIFRAILLIVLVLFYYKKIGRKHLFILIPLGISIMIASVFLKYRFLRGYSNTAYLNSGNWIYLFLTSDFSATGRNTQYLLNNAWTNGYFGIELLFNEFFRGIIPFVSFINPSAWYNYDVYPGSFKGQAFTYVGFGHVIGGVLGVILVFILLGFFVRYVYRKSEKNIYSLVFYLYSITIVSGCYRQTLNTIVNISLKSVLIMILFSKILSKVSIK